MQSSRGAKLLALSPDQTRAANESCACTSLDRQILGTSLASRGGLRLEQLPQTHPHLFSDAPVFVPGRRWRRCRIW